MVGTTTTYLLDLYGRGACGVCPGPPAKGRRGRLVSVYKLPDQQGSRLPTCGGRTAGSGFGDGKMFFQSRNIMRIVAVSIATLLASACSSQYSLTVDSSPRGAMILGNGSAGYYASPQIFYYQSGNQNVNPKTGCMIVQGFQARWKSGATASSPSPIELCGNFAAWTVIIKRPPDHPNMEEDLVAESEYLELQRNLQYEQQRSAVLEQQRQEEQSRARARENWSNNAKDFGYLLGCAAAGGCKR